MRKLILAIVALLALFSALRAFPQAETGGLGVQLHPGLVEIGDGSASVGVAFGVMDGSDSQSGQWSLLPLRMVYRSGDRSFSVGLNGLSFLLNGGFSVGRPQRISSPRGGDVISVGGKVTVDARVDGDVWAMGADVQLTPRADVTGDVVALGGRVIAAGGAVVRGSISQEPRLKIPYLGVLGTQFSAQALAFGRHILTYILLGFALFLSSYYLSAHAKDLYRAMGQTWRATLLTLALSAVLVPILVLLLVVSVIGVFFLPVLVLALMLAAFDGFLLLCARLGGLVRGGPAQEGGGDALYLFSSGLLGLFLIKLPALVGIILTMLRSEPAARVGQALQLVSLGAVAVGLLYGFGVSLAHVRVRAAR
ncbi:MAG: hypothetical protein ACHQ1F_12675 [Spirochaetia bacterium]